MYKNLRSIRTVVVANLCILIISFATILTLISTTTILIQLLNMKIEGQNLMLNHINDFVVSFFSSFEKTAKETRSSGVESYNFESGVIDVSDKDFISHFVKYVSMVNYQIANQLESRKESIHSLADARGNSVFCGFHKQYTSRYSPPYRYDLTIKNASMDTAYVEFKGRNISTGYLYQMPISTVPEWKNEDSREDNSMTYKANFWYNHSMVPNPTYTFENKNWFVKMVENSKNESMVLWNEGITFRRKLLFSVGVAIMEKDGEVGLGYQGTNIKAVVSVGTDIYDIQYYLINQIEKVGWNGKVFIFSTSGYIIGTSDRNESLYFFDEDNMKYVHTIETIEDKSIRRIANLVKEETEGYTIDSENVELFGGYFWVGEMIVNIREIKLSGVKLFIGTYVPFWVIFEKIIFSVMLQIGVSLCTLGVSVAVSLVMSYLIVYPLKLFIKEMKKIESLDLDRVDLEKWFFTLFEELLSLRNVFGFVVYKLVEYRKFLPQQLFTKDEEEDKQKTESFNSFRSISDFSQSSELKERKLFGLGLEIKELIMVTVRFFNFERNLNNGEDVVDLHSKLLEKINVESSKKRGYILSFLLGKIEIYFVRPMNAIRFATEIKKFLLEKMCDDFQIFMYSDFFWCGNLGCETLRSFQICGEEIKKMKNLVRRVGKIKGKIIVSKSFYDKLPKNNCGMKACALILKKNEIIPVFEFLTLKERTDQEWMYELAEKKEVEKYNSLNNGVIRMLESKFKDAKKDIKSFLEKNDDAEGKAFLRFLENVIEKCEKCSEIKEKLNTGKIFVFNEK